MTFRSVDMSRYKLIIPADHAYETINQIGQLSSAHFLDNGAIANRPYHGQLKRCQELLQNLNLIKGALSLAEIKPEHYDTAEVDYMQVQHQTWKDEAKKLGVEDSKLLDFYENQISQEYSNYQESLHRFDKFKLKLKNLLQKIACMETIQSFFGSSSLRQESQDYFANYALDGEDMLSGISYIIGTIDKEAEDRFNRMVYRVSRGYACTRALEQFKFEGLADFQEKVVMVIYPNSSSGILSRKLERVMNTFCTNVQNMDGFQKKTVSFDTLKSEYEQVKRCMQISEKELNSFLQRIKGVGFLNKWYTFVNKQKYLYDNLNKLQSRNHFMIANVYIRSDQVEQLSISLSHLKPSPTLQPIPIGQPPTAFSTNCYTDVAQEITDTYGIPRYKQINPSIFTSITFPFFFGVMFGDIGHGGVLFALGLYLIFEDQKIRKSSLSFLSRLRYMITLMGFFAFYCGWIYNDFIGFNINMFSSCYDEGLTPASDLDSTLTQLRPIPAKHGCIYPFGIDPIWGRAQNQLIFLNGLKMKLAVIIGVIHMILGIFIKAYNALYFRKKLDFWFQFIPQIIFMTILFGYMDFLIIFKWLQPWDQKIGDTPPKQWAPSIITTMMNIGLEMGKTSNKPDGSSSMWGQKGHSWQNQLQLAILFVAFLCIPIMLLPKPIIEIKNKKKKGNPLSLYESLDSEAKLSESLLSSGNYEFDAAKIEGQGHEQDSSEIFVHQLIETIEFVLGAVSNTASYLRLWALSLAHSQLAKVFFEKTLQNALETKSMLIMIPGMIITFYMLCWITTGVLMCMDTMECFLHSLRLHWVQFQNKFYKGDGYRFQPLSFAHHLNQLNNH